jgi:hypothetical protein
VPNTRGVLDFDLMEQTAIELQHVNVKLLVDDPAKVDLAALVPVFHRWIQGQICDELLIDVADYSHVPDGPGILLVGHQADYSVDNTDGRLGIRYNRKAPLEGTNTDRLVQAFASALRAAQRLEEEPALNGTVRFNGREVEVFFNDRLLTPNDPATRSAVEPQIKRFLDPIFGEHDYSISAIQDSRRLLTFRVRSAKALGVAEILRRFSAGHRA